MYKRYEPETWPVGRPTKDLSYYISTCYSSYRLKSYGPLLMSIKNFVFAFLSGLKFGSNMMCTLLYRALVGLKSVTGDLQISV